MIHGSMVQAGQSEFDGMPPQTYICVDCAWDTEKRETIVYFWGKEFQRDVPENDMLLSNRSSLGLGSTSYSLSKGSWSSEQQRAVSRVLSTDSYAVRTPPCAPPCISLCAHVGSATLSQLAFPGKSNPNFPWGKFQWVDTVVSQVQCYYYLMPKYYFTTPLSWVVALDRQAGRQTKWSQNM